MTRFGGLVLLVSVLPLSVAPAQRTADSALRQAMLTAEDDRQVEQVRDEEPRRQQNDEPDRRVRQEDQFLDRA